MVRTNDALPPIPQNLSADDAAPLCPLRSRPASRPGRAATLSSRQSLSGSRELGGTVRSSQRKTDFPLHALSYVVFSFTDGQWRYCQWPFVFPETDYRQKTRFPLQTFRC